MVQARIARDGRHQIPTPRCSIGAARLSYPLAESWPKGGAQTTCLYTPEIEVGRAHGEEKSARSVGARDICADSVLSGESDPRRETTDEAGPFVSERRESHCARGALAGGACMPVSGRQQAEEGGMGQRGKR